MTTKEDFKKINKLYTSEEEERLPDGERVFKKVETKLSMDTVSGLPEAMAEIRVDMLKLIYPIGAIYTSVNNVSPNNLFGGTWVSFGAGKVLVGVDPNDTAYNTVEKTGGSKTNTLAVANLPAHTHSFSATSGNQSANHTHSVGAHSHGLNSHTHSVGAHSHGLNSHTHSIPALSGTAAHGGAHTHNFQGQLQTTASSSKTWLSMYWPRDASSPNAVPPSMHSSGAHSHSVSTTASTTGKASGSTANSTAFNTGGASGNTANSAAFNSGSNSGNHTHSVSGTTGSTGSGTAFNTVDPYITVYMWRRTA